MSNSPVHTDPISGSNVDMSRAPIQLNGVLNVTLKRLCVPHQSKTARYGRGSTRPLIETSRKLGLLPRVHAILRAKRQIGQPTMQTPQHQRMIDTNSGRALKQQASTLPFPLSDGQRSLPQQAIGLLDIGGRRHLSLIIECLSADDFFRYNGQISRTA